MKKEEKYLIIIMLFALLLIILSIIIGVFLGEIYLLLWMTLLFSGAFIILLILYLRIQHNIDNKARLLMDKSEISGEVTDFLQSLLNYFEDFKKEQENIQKRMAAGVEDMFNLQYEQIKNLQKELDKKLKK